MRTLALARACTDEDEDAEADLDSVDADEDAEFEALLGELYSPSNWPFDELLSVFLPVLLTV